VDMDACGIPDALIREGFDGLLSDRLADSH
jgi:hypothetical protein